MVLELARQGNPKAIAALINRALKAQGITAKASLKGDCLRVMLESIEVPSQPAMVHLIHQGMTKLGVESIKSVKVYGRKTGIDFPAWSQELDVSSQLPSASQNPPQAQLTQTDLSAAKPSDLSDPPLVAPDLSQVTEDSVKQFQSDSKAKVAGFPKRISQILIGSLGLRIMFDSLFVLYTLVWATSYYLYSLLDGVDLTGSLVYLIRYLVVAIDFLWYPLELISIWTYRLTVVITLVWLYRLHVRLRTIFNGYPIKPWGAVARFIIPFYSLWGIWNIFATLANRLKSQGGELVSFGTSLRRWLPWFYLLLISSTLLKQIYRFQVKTEDLSLGYFVIKNVVALFFSIVWLQIVCLTNKAIVQTLKENFNQLHPPLSPTNNLPSNTSKKNSIRAVSYGLIFDILGTLAIQMIISFVIGFVIRINRTLAEAIVGLFYSYPYGLVVRLSMGLIFTGIGGFITAKFAPNVAIKHAFAMGTLSVLVSLVMIGFQAANGYQAIALLLTIPAALLGGYLRQMTSNS